MAGLGEEVEGLDGVDLISVFQKALEVAHLGGRVAGDVNDPARIELKELLKKILAAALSRRVDDDGCFRGREGDVGKEVLGGSGDEAGVLDSIGAGIPASPVGGSFREFDSNDLLELVGERESEKSGATVGIEEIPLPGLAGLLGSMAGEGFENERVVLEKVSREEVEGELTDFLGNRCPMVGFHTPPGCAHEESGSLLVSGGIGFDLCSQCRKFVIDDIHGNGAVVDIDQAGAAIELEKSNGEIGPAFGFLEMRSDLGAVAPFFWGRNGRQHLGVNPYHVFKEFPDLTSLPTKLFLVGEVLILAASTGGKVATFRFNAIRRSIEDLDQISVGAIGFVPPDSGPDFFSGESEGDEDDPVVGLGNASSQIGECDNVQFDDLVPLVGLGLEFRRAGLGHGCR